MKHVWFALIALGICGSAWAFEPFTIQDIRVEGLRRISAGTVFSYLPVKVNEEFNEQRSAQSIKALFKTGFFKDVRLERDGNVLVVIVDERPSIAKIDITGNKDVSTDDLLAGLKKIGLSEGRVFNRSLLDKLEQELRRQYFSNGKYGVKIKTTISPMERNRVGISLEISEGKVAKIREINIVGNKVFKSKDLLKLFNLSTPTTFSFYTGVDQYSKQKLAADLETLRSYYLDHGFLNFKIVSTQVSISPDKKYIYITINIQEGDQYTVKEVKLAGDLIVPDELAKKIVVVPGMVYSQKDVAQSTTRITKRLGNEGYAFANVNTVPELDHENKQVTLTFFVDPGKRVYVRRINFLGNSKTGDEIMRREMRQMEGGWFSTEKVNRSKVRLDRLGYFEDVNVETPAVPGTTDQVDVNYTVTEKPSGNILASIGYSQSGGILLSGSIQQDNFLGTGKRVGVGVNNSDINKGFNIDYYNPYYTIDGVSRGFSLSSTKTDAAAANLSDYTTDEDRIAANYGIPISENNRILSSIGYSRTTLKATSYSSAQVTDYITNNGSDFTKLTLGLGWTLDTRNRAVFADRGIVHSISAEVAVPGGDLQYYKGSYKQQRFIPLSKSLTLSMRGEVAYGHGYGDTPGSLPFFENYFAGGVRSVRGFKDNSLGPRDSRNLALGGALKTVGSLELIFPPPFASESKSVRVSAFVDVGQVFGGISTFSLGGLRASTGVSLIWLSPVGPLSFSLATPIREGTNDQTQAFQFTLGTSVF